MLATLFPIRQILDTGTNYAWDAEDSREEAEPSKISSISTDCQFNRSKGLPMKMTRLTIRWALATLALSGVGAASAALAIFTGSDPGAGVAGPFPNSAAAQTAFLLAAAGQGSTSTIDFESLAPGYAANFLAATGVSVSLTGANYGPGFSGISDSTIGNVWGFNTTSGGSNWLGFLEGSATFNFDDPIAAFGFYLTGVQQSLFGTMIGVTFNNGTTQQLLVPGTANGGAAFFGFVNSGASISSLQIYEFGIDAWGIDDVLFTRANVPEPSSLLLASLAGLSLLTQSRRRLARH
jgi:hypothetical protein